ncbi:hypothetical protein CMI37_36435 [Candidatus Pacearchaeota archaeon]|nr:hypothetical protein [Candidatus Pacearchaeota archaeon]|tara:strand:+ start:301 stop:645 length:345 start_codon:yes stop_codon:yes gene_type:complete
MELDLVGKWAFIIGLVVAVLAALAGDVIGASTVLLILFILGLVVGFLNIDKANTTEFLVAVIALLILGVGSIGALSIIGTTLAYVESILGNFTAFVGAAALVVSIKAIIVTGKK